MTEEEDKDEPTVGDWLQIHMKSTEEAMEDVSALADLQATRTRLLKVLASFMLCRDVLEAAIDREFPA
jgi:hypothetical protein